MSMSSVNAAGAITAASPERVPRQPPKAGGEADAARVPEPAPSRLDVQVRELEAASARIERYVQSSGRSLHFRVDHDSGRVVVSVRDSSTGDLIRQIPSEAALRIARALDRSESTPESVLIEEKA